MGRAVHPAAAALANKLRIPLIGAPMFILSGPELVIAQCQAGIVGSFPALNARQPGELEQWIDHISEALRKWDHDNPDRPSAPFAVNQIVHRSNARLDHDMGILADKKVPIVISSLGARPEVNAAVHGYGGLVLHDVVNNTFARKAIEKGADGLIAVAAGAGGHAGQQSPFALIQEIREWFDGPLALSGAIANGRSLMAANLLGADFGYAGSVFIPTTESRADPNYKQMVTECGAEDILYSDYFTGINGNYLKPSIVRAGLDLSEITANQGRNLDVLNHRQSGETKIWKDIWGAGQGIRMAKQTSPTSAIIDRLAEEYCAARSQLFAE